ncbi:MAG: hypothetical protein DMG03_07760 [Acidobacteria bacterium]|nr:MAG: hypothetical protein DMG03_07760 [Acidobacteriota bacterium]
MHGASISRGIGGARRIGRRDRACQGGRARGNQQPGPTITVRGHTFTQLSLFQRNVGGPDDMTTPFPPHKVIGNIYYVGTKSLAEFDPEGYKLEVDIDEAMFRAVLAGQQR